MPGAPRPAVLQRGRGAAGVCGAHEGGELAAQRLHGDAWVPVAGPVAGPSYQGVPGAPQELRLGNYKEGPPIVRL